MQDSTNKRTLEELTQERKRLIEAMREELSKPLRNVPKETNTGDLGYTREETKLFNYTIIPSAKYELKRIENVPETITTDFNKLTEDEVTQAFAKRMDRANSLLDGEGQSFVITEAVHAMSALQEQMKKNERETLAVTEATESPVFFHMNESPSVPVHTQSDLPDNTINFTPDVATYTQARINKVSAKIAARQAERAWGELYTAAISAGIESSALVNWEAITAKVSELGSESDLAKALEKYSDAYNKTQQYTLEDDNKSENASQYTSKHDYDAFQDEKLEEELEEELEDNTTPVIDNITKLQKEFTVLQDVKTEVTIAKLKKEFATLQDITTEVTIANEVFAQLQGDDKQDFIDSRAFKKLPPIEALDGLKGKERLYNNLFAHGENAIYPLTDLAISEKLKEMLKTKEDLIYNVSPSGLHQIFSLKSPPQLLAVFEEEFLRSPNNSNLIKIITLDNNRTDAEYLTRIRKDLNLDNKAKVPESLIDFYKRYDTSHSTHLRPMVLKNLQQLITKTCMRDGKIIDYELNNVLEIFNKTLDNSPRKINESNKDFVRRMAISDPVRFNKRSDLLIKSGVPLQGKFTTNMAIFTNEDVANILKNHAKIEGVITHVEVIRLKEAVKPQSSWIALPSMTKSNIITCMVVIGGKTQNIDISQKDFKKLFHTKTHQEICFEDPDLNKNFGLGTGQVFSNYKLEDIIFKKPQQTFAKKAEPSKTMGDVDVVKTILNSLSISIPLEKATIEVLTSKDLEKHHETPRLTDPSKINAVQSYDAHLTNDKISIKIGIIQNGKTSNYIYEVTPKELKALFSEHLKDHKQISTNTRLNEVLGTSVGKSASR